ncbi:hypothetical protein AB9E65_13765 [Escherichia coli]|uniref:hypothetical protein n=1 Tax=Escherichia coli TaxID=562 RepID=UPI0038B6285A
MVRYVKYARIVIGITALTGGFQAVAGISVGTSQQTQFIATINDGTCELSYSSDPTLIFMPRLASEFSPGTTVQVKAIVANVGCTYAVTPQVKVEGITPYAGNTRVFLDDGDWPGGTNGVGFMVQPATTIAERDTVPSLNDFYTNGMAGKAIENAATVNLIPLAENCEFCQNQVLWVGLVGMADSSQIVPGSFQATLTITGIIP